MDHDFASANGGETGTCNKLGGIMSYGTPLASGNIWSTCSKNSFQAHYNTIVNSGTWCMEGLYLLFMIISLCQIKINKSKKQ